MITAKLHRPTITDRLAKFPSTIPPHERYVHVANNIASVVRWNKDLLEGMLLEAQAYCCAAEFAVKDWSESTDANDSKSAERTSSKEREENEEKCRFYEILIEVLEGNVNLFCVSGSFVMICIGKIKKLKTPVDEGSWEDDYGRNLVFFFLVIKSEGGSLTVVMSPEMVDENRDSDDQWVHITLGSRASGLASAQNRL
ncbi:Putative protein of unknown function [Podospora comata]|uniref:Uncharacterized protein n=1 Tax=Podospora comata TaxID=48703 RepID=A0ABY6SE67_PODCO|nr:Putative protein of unknown function [Podospora comata]